LLRFGTPKRERSFGVRWDSNWVNHHSKPVLKRCKPKQECALALGPSPALARRELMSVDLFGTKQASSSYSAILCTGLIFVGLLPTGCSRNKSLARVPVTSLPSVGYQGPAPEIENQSTSAPIMVETLPEPTATRAEA